MASESPNLPNLCHISDLFIQSSRSILSLPPELLSEILSYLSGGEISTASKVCQSFYEGCNADYVWKIRCRNEFGVSDISGWNCSYKEIYTKVLYRYGWMLGLWQPDRRCYGGLYCVKMNNVDGALECWSYDPPRPSNVSVNLRSKQLFTVEIRDGDTCVRCKSIKDEKHPAELTTNANHDLCFKCLRHESHRIISMNGSDVIPEGHANRFSTWLQEEFGLLELDIGIFDQDLLSRKYNAFMEYECEFQCKRLIPPRSTPGALVQPGFFKGDYAAHGLEIIQLSYSEQSPQLEMLKITGDPNIPAGSISMNADITQPIVLTLAQQESMELLSEIDLPDPDPDMQVDQLPSQPFKIPLGCTREGVNVVPDKCRWRFSGSGQVAYDNYTSPTFIEGHFIIFDEDTLGFLWIDLEAFCYLKRCTEPDLANK